MGSIAKHSIKNQWVEFLPGNQEEFLEKVINKSKSRIKDLALLVNVHPKTLSDWRREKTRMSLRALEVFSRKYGITTTERKETLIERWKNSQKKANKVGGMVRLRRYGSPGTTEGRKKGGLKTMEILRKKGIIFTKNRFNEPTYSKELAEFVGIMLGDGGITFEQCTITLNGEADANYILFIKVFLNTLFGVAPKLFKHKHDKAVVIYYYGVALVAYLKGLGLKPGNKVKQQVDVPEWIKNDKEYSIACLRGLMDTDGGVFLHNYKIHGKEYSYKKICFTNKSVPLLAFVFNTLQRLKFTPKYIANKRIWLYDQNDVLRYNAVVGTHNSRLLVYLESGPDGKAQVC